MAAKIETKMRLIIHQKHYSTDDGIMNVKDIPDAKEGDTIVVWDPELDDVQPRLLLQIPIGLPKGNEVPKDNISIEQSIASTFNLRSYHDVLVTTVDPKEVTIELLELTFKDQYFARSDMWRLKKSLVNKVMYINKKIEYLKGSMRCQVYEMWSQGEKVACGVVDEDTKVVFRSYTCQCYLFLQMSAEMWDVDIYGDRYFEKAVDGFLKELFAKWGAKEGANHDVTIVLFSRTYYKANSIDEFPVEMQPCLQEDYQGRFYEDFYRVAIQNERVSDWRPIVRLLHRLFYHYKDTVLSFHSHLEEPIPEAYNSDAAQGNFLEVLNISLNVFEKHYLDRSFDRTGQMSVVITPGVGMFEVDRELTSITNQRIIDNGVGSDLVCVGEQPLHAVPLFKFHKKRKDSPDDYSMPNTWINLSFYRSKKRSVYGSFVPSFKNPFKEPREKTNELPKVPCVQDWLDAGHLLNTVYDYEAYDEAMTRMPTQNARQLQRIPPRKKTTSQCAPSGTVGRSNFPRKLSDSDVYRSAESISGSLSELTLTSSTGATAKSPAINIPVKLPDYKGSKSFGGLNWEGPRPQRSSGPEDKSSNIFGKTSSGANSPSDLSFTSPRRGQNVVPRRSLINPFNPSHMTIKRTSYRRRWIHTFPKGPTGALIQQHYFQSSPVKTSETEDGVFADGISSDSVPDHSDKLEQKRKSKATLLWGATGEQEWNAGIKTDVDWKSLTLPACFPLTTDYFPEEPNLSNAYVVASNYSLLPEEVYNEVKGRKTSPREELMEELISQRLGQGCQLIIDYDNKSDDSDKASLVMSGKDNSLETEYKLSIGRVFHRLVWKDSDIGITVYKPRHPYAPLKRRYKYRFHSPYLQGYELSWAEFKTESLESYMWNYLDNLVSTRGDEYPLRENLKYWRVRLMIVPDSHKHIVKELTAARVPDSEGKLPPRLSCDRYYKISLEEQRTAVEGFVKFMEVLHKIKRPMNKNKSRTPGAMRERLGSNRMERPRLRTGPKERVRFESGSKDENPSREIDEDIKEEGELKRLTRDTNVQEIIEAMRDPVNGVPLIAPQPGLSPYTFIASDATYWVVRRFEDIHSEDMAIDLLRELLVKNLIRHASGERNIYYVHGFYLYYFLTGNAEAYKPSSLSYDTEWHEVKVNPLDSKKAKTSSSSLPGLPPCPVFLLPELPHPDEDPTLSATFTHVQGNFKLGHIDIDVNDKSDRREWGEIKYHKTFSPLEGYEMVLQWMVASGTLVNDLISMWQRKAMNLGLHLFPMPSDPFALPLSYSSDPLRSPIVIPLRVGSVLPRKQVLFGEFSQASRPRRLWIFMKHILERFGFMPFKTEVDGDVQNQFVHVTGNMFVMIASDNTAIHVQSPRKISRSHPTGLPSLEDPKFLWTFNYMLSRRWKSQLSSDESLGERIMEDFQKFCNSKARLRAFYNSFLEQPDGSLDISGTSTDQ